MTKTLTSPLRLLSLLALWLLMSLGIAQAATETITYFHNDVAGTPILATHATGSVVWKENYQPYGSRINNAPGGDNSQWFTGKPYDPNTGLSYFGARYYDPVIGRFTGTDPAGVDPANIHGLNRYSYGNNNPFRYVDPDGKENLPSVEVEDYDLRRQALANDARMVSEAGTWTLETAWAGLKEFALAKGSGAVFALGTKVRSAEEIAREMRSIEAVRDARVLSGPIYRTTKEAAGAAEALGFRKINETVHEGQAVFRRGKYFITRDLDGHNGGAWKMAKSVDALGSKETRMGTYDVSLNRVGD